MFRKKKIVTQQTVGEYLKKVRLGKELSIGEVSKRTRISEQHLHSIENGDYLNTPIGEIYVLNFIKIYTNFLGVSKEKMLEKYKQERHIMENRLKHKALGRSEEFSLFRFVMSPKFLHLLGISMFVLMLVGYLGYQVLASKSSPGLIISYPSDNLVVRESKITVFGKTEPEVDVKINEQDVLVNEDGEFEEQINLKEGINLIVVTATKSNNSQTKAVLRVVVVEEENREFTLK